MTKAMTFGEFEAGLKSRCAARPYDTLYNIGQWILGLSQ